MPCLRNGDFKLIESGAIAEYLENTHPEPTLTVNNMQVLTEIQSSVFPAIAKFIKAPSYDADLEKSLMVQLGALNDHMQGKTYLAGDKLSLVDFSLAPKLYHMEATLEEFYPKVHEKLVMDAGTLPALKSYMDTMFAHEAFKAALYPKETVIWGWSAARSS